MPENIVHFIDAIDNMFMLSELVVLLPRWSRTFLPLWKRFVQAWDDLSGVGNDNGWRPFIPSNLDGFSHDSACLFFLVARMLIDQRVAEIAVRRQSGELVEGLYLSHLLSSDHMSMAEVYTCITELLLGGVDTVRLDKVRYGIPHLLKMFCMPECVTH